VSTQLPLSQREARGSILRRQGLIEPFDEPLQAVRAMVAVQTQYAASLPVAVAARLKKCRAGWDDAALQPGGSLIKSWSLRHTLHAHTRDDHALVVGSLGSHLHQDYIRFMQRRHTTSDIHKLEELVLAALQHGPMSRRELHERVPQLKSIDYVGWGMDVMGLAFRRRVCVVGRGATQMFCPLPEVEVEPSYGELLKRYLASFGPATVADFTFWTGLKAPLAKKAFSEASDDLVTVTVEGMKGVRYALANLVTEESSKNFGVRLLAKFDPLVLAHKDKSLFIPIEHKTKVFRKAGQVEAVVLMDGIASGTWRIDRNANRATFTVEPFRPFGKRETVQLRLEAERMAKAIGSKAAEVQFA